MKNLDVTVACFNPKTEVGFATGGRTSRPQIHSTNRDVGTSMRGPNFQLTATEDGRPPPEKQLLSLVSKRIDACFLAKLPSVVSFGIRAQVCRCPSPEHEFIRQTVNSVRIHGRYQRAGRAHEPGILDKFYLTQGLRPGVGCVGPNPTYKPG